MARNSRIVSYRPGARTWKFAALGFPAAAPALSFFKTLSFINARNTAQISNLWKEFLWGAQEKKSGINEVPGNGVGLEPASGTFG